MSSDDKYSIGTATGQLLNVQTYMDANLITGSQMVSMRDNRGNWGHVNVPTQRLVKTKITEMLFEANDIRSTVKVPGSLTAAPGDNVRFYALSDNDGKNYSPFYYMYNFTTNTTVKVQNREELAETMGIKPFSGWLWLLIWLVALGSGFAAAVQWEVHNNPKLVKAKLYPEGVEIGPYDTPYDHRHYESCISSAEFGLKLWKPSSDIGEGRMAHLAREHPGRSEQELRQIDREFRKAKRDEEKQTIAECRRGLAKLNQKYSKQRLNAIVSENRQEEERRIEQYKKNVVTPQATAIAASIVVAIIGLSFFRSRIRYTLRRNKLWKTAQTMVHADLQEEGLNLSLDSLVKST